MYRIECGTIWGGIGNQDQEVFTSGVVASLYSSSCHGGKGGDIYYLSVCDNDLLTRVAVADVVGHGEEVSQVSQWMYNALEAHMNNAEGNDVLSELNNQALLYGLKAMTTATVIGYFQPTSTLYVAYAGHPEILVYHRDRDQWHPATLESVGDLPANLPLAVFEDVRFEQRAYPLEPGDRFLIYTDGVIETPNGADELFGRQRLIETLGQSSRQTITQLKHNILASLRAYTSGGLRHDDMTLMVIEIR